MACTEYISNKSPATKKHGSIKFRGERDRGTEERRGEGGGRERCTGNSRTRRKWRRCGCVE